MNLAMIDEIVVLGSFLFFGDFIIDNIHFYLNGKMFLGTFGDIENLEKDFREFFSKILKKQSSFGEAEKIEGGIMRLYKVNIIILEE